MSNPSASQSYSGSLRMKAIITFSHNLFKKTLCSIFNNVSLPFLILLPYTSVFFSNSISEVINFT